MWWVGMKSVGGRMQGRGVVGGRCGEGCKNGGSECRHRIITVHHMSNAVADTEPTETQVFSIEPDGDADDASPACLVWGKLVALGGVCFTDVLEHHKTISIGWKECSSLAVLKRAKCLLPGGAPRVLTPDIS